MRESDIAYAAAIIDTMANLRVRTSTGTPLPEVQVNCPNIALLAWLGQVTGTAHFATKRDYCRHGCTEHCPDAHLHIRSDSGRWSVTGVRATVLLFNVLPYTRLRQGEIADLVEVGLAAGWRSHTVKGMKDLDWAIPERATPTPLKAVGGPS